MYKFSLTSGLRNGASDGRERLTRNRTRKDDGVVQVRTQWKVLRVDDNKSVPEGYVGWCTYPFLLYRVV